MKKRGSTLRTYKTGDRVLVRGKRAVFVKVWGSGAVIRYDDAPNEPKVVPFERVEPLIGDLPHSGTAASSGDAHR